MLQEELQRRRAKLARCGQELQLLRREAVHTGGAGADSRLVHPPGAARLGPLSLGPPAPAPRPGDVLGGGAGEVVEDLGWGACEPWMAVYGHRDMRPDPRGGECDYGPC
mgnify:CR=1 FL=1